MNVRTLRTGAACLTLLMVACGVPQAAPNRCLEDVNLAELIEAEGLPQVQSQGWGISSVAEISENRLFDGEQEAVLVLDDPGPLVGRLCGRLENQISESCHVEKFWSGTEHCSGHFWFRPSAVISPSGRPVEGRVALFASKTPEGKTALTLTTTEWAQ
jgi:hypothetical protein